MNYRNMKAQINKLPSVQLLGILQHLVVRIQKERIFKEDAGLVEYVKKVIEGE